MLSQKLIKSREKESSSPLRLTESNRFDVPFLVNYAAFELLFDNNPQPMWIYDHRMHRFLAINDAAIRNYLLSPRRISFDVDRANSRTRRHFAP